MYIFECVGIINSIVIQVQIDNQIFQLVQFNHVGCSKELVWEKFSYLLQNFWCHHYVQFLMPFGCLIQALHFSIRFNLLFFFVYILWVLVEQSPNKQIFIRDNSKADLQLLFFLSQNKLQNVNKFTAESFCCISSKRRNLTEHWNNKYVQCSPTWNLKLQYLMESK